VSIFLGSVALQAGQAAPAPREPMAEEVFKNIQVMKGVPADQFLASMGFIANALAVNCTRNRPGALSTTRAGPAGRTSTPPTGRAGVAGGTRSLGCGAGGRGSAEVKGVLDKIDIFTGTLGKALGGALGGFTAGPKQVVEMLRQRSRPYLFSNSLPPHVVAAGIRVFDMLAAAGDLRRRLEENTAYFRQRMTAAGFDLKPGIHPICPVMLYDAPLAQRFAQRLLEEGIYAIGFFFPVVPKGQARIRTQLSAAHTRAQLDRAIEVFTRVGRRLGVIKA